MDELVLKKKLILKINLKFWLKAKEILKYVLENCTSVTIAYVFLFQIILEFIEHGIINVKKKDILLISDGVCTFSNKNKVIIKGQMIKKIWSLAIFCLFTNYDMILYAVQKNWFK